MDHALFTQRQRIQYRAIQVCGGFAFALGVSVLVGWFFHIPILIQVHPSFVPMQFNTALCFIFCGAGMMALMKDRPSQAAWLGGLALIIGGLTLVEYGFQLNIGLDEWFIKQDIQVNTSNPGRMAPNSALCFCLCGLSFLLIRVLKNSQNRAIVTAFLSSILFILSFTAFLGYVLHVESAYGWANLTHMALHTVAGLLVLATGFALYAWFWGRHFKLNALITTIMIVPLVTTIINYFFLSGFQFPNIPLHAGMEAMGSLAAICVGILLLFLPGQERSQTHWIFLGCSLIGMGILDLIHAFLLPGDLFVWTHTLSFFLGSIFFLLACLPTKSLSKDLFYWVTGGTLLGFSLIAGLLLLIQPVISPLVEGDSFSKTLIFSHLLGGLFFIISTVILLNRYQVFRKRDDLFFGGFCLLFSISGFTFTFSALWSFDWWMWHLYKGLAFIILLIYAFQIIQQAFKKVTDLNQTLEMRIGTLALLNRELDQSNKQLNEFTYLASHDLQEPLRNLVSFSALLPRDLGTALSSNAQKDLFFITDSAIRMQKLVQALLRLSKAGNQDVKLQDISLDTCVTEALKTLEWEISNAKASIIRMRLTHAKVDRMLMIELFRNLIENALKFHDPGRLPRIEITLQQKDGIQVFGVKDNGIGIQPEYQHKIFAPFKKLHGRKDYPGSGIGLSICRKIVERHHGTIWVESSSTDGAHFKFSIGQEISN